LFTDANSPDLVFGNLSSILLDNPFYDLEPFIALSYFWGDPTPTRVIVINGSQFGVTENLYNYLRCGQTRLNEDSRSLWIDAICIDQNNIQEREQQVGLMAEVY